MANCTGLLTLTGFPVREFESHRFRQVLTYFSLVFLVYTIFMSETYHISYKITRKKLGEDGREIDIEETAHAEVPDAYQVLGVSHNATDEEIRERWRQLSKRYHPDNSGSSDSDQAKLEMMKTINVAYDVLSKPEKRAALDREIRAGNGRPVEPSPARNRAERRRPPTVSREDQHSLYAHILNKIHNATETRDLLHSDVIEKLFTNGKISSQNRDEVLEAIRIKTDFFIISPFIFFLYVNAEQ